MIHLIKIATFLFICLIVSGCATRIPTDYSDLSKAKTLYERNKDNAAFSVYYANVLQHHNDNKQAMELLDNALTSDIKDAQLFIQASGIYKKAEALDKAQDALKKALELKPADAEIIIKITTNYTEAEQYAKAQEYWDLYLYLPYAEQYNEATYVELVNEAILNLIAQDLYIDADSLILQAKDLYPHNYSIEKNHRIIRAMMQTHGHSSPKPDKKPSHVKKDQ